ncbi:hypothetical protein D3C81_2238390 [compost metagenome]
MPLIKPILLKPPLAESGRLVERSRMKVKQPPWVICALARPPAWCTPSVRALKCGRLDWLRVSWLGKVRPSLLTAQ